MCIIIQMGHLIKVLYISAIFLFTGQLKLAMITIDLKQQRKFTACFTACFLYACTWLEHVHGAFTVAVKIKPTSM